VVTEWLCLRDVVGVLSVQCTYARNLARHCGFHHLLLLLLLLLLLRLLIPISIIMEGGGKLGARL
jgi:hypothetical protein